MRVVVLDCGEVEGEEGDGSFSMFGGGVVGVASVVQVLDGTPDGACNFMRLLYLW